MKVKLIDLPKEYKFLKKEIRKSVEEVFEKGNFILGPQLEKFEKQMARFLGIKHAVGVASGTDALLLSLSALDISSGDEVILPANSFIATAFAVSHVGAKPVFIDVDEKTYCLDVNYLPAKINKNTKAVIPVHLYGHPAAMDEILRLAKKKDFLVIEDCAQANGATYKGKMVGSFGDAAAFSFYPSKNLGAYGDGGLVATNNKKVYQRICVLRNQGQTKKYRHDLIGYNSRLDSLQAAILSVKFKYLKQWNQKRRKIANFYLQQLKRLPLILPQQTPKTKHSFYVFVVRYKNRDKLRNFLAKNDIQTQMYYPFPIHLQKAYKYLGYKRGDFPASERLSKEGLALPLHPFLEKKELEYVVSCLFKFFGVKL